MLKSWKTLRYVTLSGIALATAGCGLIGSGFWNTFWTSLVSVSAVEFVTDNDAIFDLFND